MHRYKLEQSQAARLERLLHMEYTLREIANELECSKRQLLSAVEAGCPHRKTTEGRVFITGDEFRDWYHDLCRQRKQPLAPGEVYCLRCRRPVPLPAETEIQALPNGAERIIAACPVCGATVNRFRGGDS